MKRISDEEFNDYVRRTGLDMPGMEGTVLRAIVDELRARRMADLTFGEAEALETVRTMVMREFNSDEVMLGAEVVAETRDRALSVLDRLLATGGGV